MIFADDAGYISFLPLFFGALWQSGAPHRKSHTDTRSVYHKNAVFSRQKAKIYGEEKQNVFYEKRLVAQGRPAFLQTDKMNENIAGGFSDPPAIF